MSNTPTYAELLDYATHQLEKTSDSPKIDSEVLLQHVCEKSLAWLIAHGNDCADAIHVKQFKTLVDRRDNGEPIAYIIGHKEFWSLDLKVNKHVLIPRADTEALVEQTLRRLNTSLAYSVLDLGTGSGAIALAIAKERPLAQVLAVDSQIEALNVAEENADINKIENVNFLCSNWFDSIPNTKYDLIASNPPYVEINDPHLEQGDLRFEPNTALVGGGDGFDDIKMIIETAVEYLAPNGHLLIEHGFEQHQLVAKLMTTAGFSKIEMSKDINKLPRCTIGQWLA